MELNPVKNEPPLEHKEISTEFKNTRHDIPQLVNTRKKVTEIPLVSKISKENPLSKKVYSKKQTAHINYIRGKSYSSKVRRSNIHANRKAHNPSVGFDGSAFLHTQVRSNKSLQSLLQDIVSLNSEIHQDEDENAVNQEISRLRSRNNLPSLSIPTFLDDDSVTLDTASNNSESFENDSNFENESTTTEHFGKGSGCDSESQHSWSCEKDSESEIKVKEEKEQKSGLVIEEPEFIDLDKYYDNQKSSDTEDSTAKKEKPKNSKDTTTKNCSLFMSPTKTPGIFRCELCYVSYTSIQSLRRHLRAKHSDYCVNTLNNSASVRTCLFCDFKTNTLKKYNLHVALEHTTQNNVEHDDSSDEPQIMEVE